jgi:hypothetical protein
MSDQSDQNGAPPAGADEGAAADPGAGADQAAGADLDAGSAADPGASADPDSAADPESAADLQVAVDPADMTGQAASVIPGLSQVQLALFAGWTMAVLYGDIATRPAGRPPELPTVNELPAAARRNLELIRLRHLLAGLLPGFASMERVDHLETGNGPEHDAQRWSQLQLLNVAILNALTGKPAQVQLAYELGRSLRDTANPPKVASAAKASGQSGEPGREESEPRRETQTQPGGQPAKTSEDPVVYQLAQGRIAKLQEWLAVLSEAFPDQATAVVAGSLGRWSDFATMALGSPAGTTRRFRSKLRRGSGRGRIKAEMRSYLLAQGDVWLMLLTGEETTAGLLTPEGYVAAGEAALHRSGVMVRGVIRHYWAALLLIAAALGGVLYLAAAYLGGASKVWTSIAAIGCSLGVSAQTVAAKTSRLASEAGKPVLAMSEEDVMAWAITSLPPARFTFRGVRRLRKAGIAPTASLSRI